MTNEEIWQSKGKYFIKARRLYLLATSRLDKYRDELTKKNIKPTDDIKYRVRRNKIPAIARTYCKAWDDALAAYNKIKE